MSFRRTFGRTALLGAVSALLLASLGCQAADPSKAGREAAERAKAAIRAIDADAHDQKVSPDVVKRVQEQLTAIKEYQGPIDGKLDAVTLNAFEAFQRSLGLTADGMFTDKVLGKLAEAAARAGKS
ncbi:peptidoglycan-binding protein [bacterium]|nr:peptidoglycan-binding protein [bacterium]